MKLETIVDEILERTVIRTLPYLRDLAYLKIQATVEIDLISCSVSIPCKI